MRSNKSLIRILIEPLAFAVVAAFCLRALVHGYSIPSPSMEPALLAGDHILVTSYLPGLGFAPSRGDVAVFRLDGDELFVKRIVAGPGDRVEVKGIEVFVNGKALDERYLAARVDNGSLPPFTVPSGHYFVMGDNREHSLDSRSFGTIAEDSLVGKARFIFWSSTNPTAFDEKSAMAWSNDPTPLPAGNEGVRWRRILRHIH